MIRLTKEQYIVSRLSCVFAQYCAAYYFLGPKYFAYYCVWISVVGLFISSETKE